MRVRYVWCVGGRWAVWSWRLCVWKWGEGVGARVKVAQGPGREGREMFVRECGGRDGGGTAGDREAEVEGAAFRRGVGGYV